MQPVICDACGALISREPVRAMAFPYTVNGSTRMVTTCKECSDKINESIGKHINRIGTIVFNYSEEVENENSKDAI